MGQSTYKQRAATYFAEKGYDKLSPDEKVKQNEAVLRKLASFRRPCIRPLKANCCRIGGDCDEPQS